MFVIVKCADIFRVGKGEFFARRYFPRDEFSIGEGSFFRGEEVEVSWEILNWGALPEFLNKIIFICLTFSLPTQFYEWTC